MQDAQREPAADSTARPAGANNLVLRVLSAVILAPLALATAYIGGWPFALFWTLAAVAVLWEWITLVAGPGYLLMFSPCAAAIGVAAFVELRNRPITAVLLVCLGLLAALIFAPRPRRLWIAAGIGYAGAMLLAPMLLRADADYGWIAVVLLFAIVWATDVLAYFAGRAFGGPKLCPPISPKKTWSGAIAGALGGMAIAAGLAQAHVFGSYSTIAFAVIGLLLSIIAQGGDLLESWVKRRFGAKDASHLIPGHGGVMDRLDGFWAAALAACVFGIARGGLHNAGLGLLVW